MPTGLTSGIYDGTNTSLRQFALRCAKHFGGGYEASDYGEKDLSLTTPPVLKPSTFHQECLKRAEEDLTKWEDLKAHPEKLKKAYKKYFEDREREKDEFRTRCLIIRERYEKARKKIEAWDVPGNFRPIKDFMLEQIDKSIEADCHFDPSWFEVTREPMDKWIDRNIKFSKENIERQKACVKKAEESVAKINDYMARFYTLLDELEPLDKCPILSDCAHNEVPVR